MSRFQPDEPDPPRRDDPEEEHEPFLTKLRYPADDESGDHIGWIDVDMNSDGTTPLVVRDEYGTTWVAVRRGYVGAVTSYERARCAEAHFFVKK